MAEDDTAAATVLVTGASRRLGRAMALDLAQSGWRVGVHYHASATAASSVVDEIEAMGGHAAALDADLCRHEDLAPLIEACVERLGTPTCLINNAACFEWDSVDSLTAESWAMHLDLNLRAPVFLTQAFARTLPAHISGNVINVIDQKVWRLNPDYFSYTIAKSALWTATQTLAQALAPRIRVNAIAPGAGAPGPRPDRSRVLRGIPVHAPETRGFHGRRHGCRPIPAGEPLDHRPDDRARWGPAPGLERDLTGRRPLNGAALRPYLRLRCRACSAASRQNPMIPCH
jgi:NAD(P)-dependent dehydrogenase (short-subunit alcohol dehydrogenase family)